MSFVAWLIIAVMIGLNALLASYEIALASVSVGRLKALADQHRPGGRAALYMKQRMEASLAVVQLGITLVGAVAAATGGANVQDALEPWFEQRLGFSHSLARVICVFIIVVPLSAVMIVVGELIPKVFALRNKEWVCLKLSPAMRLTATVLHPAVWALEGTVKALMSWWSRRWQAQLDDSGHDVSEMQELRAVVSLARTSLLIGGQEEKIILGAARLSGRALSEIMIPANEIITLHVTMNMSEALIAAHADMHTRFPVVETPGDVQSIHGYVNFKDIVSELRLSPDEPSLRGIMREIPDLLGELSIAASLQRMTRSHVHIALVRDANRHVIGMVTLEDILEELVGDIQDEYDRAPTHVAGSGAGWVMGGGITLERLEQTTGAKINRQILTADTRTLDDWVRFRLGGVIHGGDIVRGDGLRVLVRKVRRQRVLEAHVLRDDSAQRDGGAAAPAAQARSDA